MFIFKETIFSDDECRYILSSNEKTNVIDYFPEYKSKIENFFRSFKIDVSPIIIYSWVMRYGKGEGGPWHLHRGIKGHSFSANVFLSGDPDIGLWIRDSITKEEVLHKNKIGEIMIMNCDVYHKPETNFSNQERYVLGMTIHDVDFNMN